MVLKHTDIEIASQPQMWLKARDLATGSVSGLPQDGERIAVVGCGTSWFMAMAYAAERESGGRGETDAFVASEYPSGRRYDRILAITRSGTTTEVLRLINRLTDVPCTVITAVPEAVSVSRRVDIVDLSFADEQSVVQTRFATTALALLRASLGVDTTRLAMQCDDAFRIDIGDIVGFDQVTFLGSGAAVGLSYEAALKAREAAQLWAEAYPAMDYRHGPIAIAQPGRLVWALSEPPDGLAAQVAATGARLIYHDLDPMCALVVTQRFAVAAAEYRGLNPDTPRALTRSVVLTSDHDEM